MGLKDGFGLNGGGNGGGGGVPGGSKNSVQYNNNGSFGGSDNFHISSPDTTPSLYVLNDTTKNGIVLTGAVQVYSPDGLHSVTINLGDGGSSDITFIIPPTNAQGVLKNDGSGNLSWTSMSDALTQLPEFVSIAAAQGAGYSGKYVTLTGVTVGVLTLNLVVKVP